MELQAVVIDLRLGDSIDVEREPAYMEIARARIAYWAARPIEAA